MFKIIGTKSLDSNAIKFTKSGINFIGRTFENNGIQGKIQRQNFEPNEPFSITATVIGNYKYVKFQKEPYYCSQNINKLTPKAIIEKWNEKIAYYFVANLQKFVSLYDGQQGGYKLKDIKSHILRLPLKNNKIDFEFMERFILKLEIEKMLELKLHLTTNGLENYNLTKEEERALNNYNNLNFKDFYITDIFNIKNTKNILSRDIIRNSGKIPYLCASAENNSISSYISYDKNYLDKGNCIFIGGKTFVVTYQKSDFYSNDSHNLALYLKSSEKNRFNQLYLATCITKSLDHKYHWGDSVSNNKIQNDKISLPIIESKIPLKNNKPDYTTMNLIISAIQKLMIKDIVIYTNKVLKNT